MDFDERERLQKEAQNKLAQANALIEEAGDLAERGKFFLEFGEIGDYVPTGFMDDDVMRPIALEEAKREGRYHAAKYEYPLLEGGGRDWKNPIVVEPERTVPWDQLSADEQDELVESFIESYREQLPWEFREFSSKNSGGEWWHPSRC